MSEEYQTTWLARRVTTFFLAKTKYDLKNDFSALDLYYYCDQYNLDTFKENMLKKYQLTIDFTQSLINKSSYRALRDETKFKLAKIRLLNILRDNRRFTNVYEVIKDILEGFENKEAPRVKERQILPFENVFKHPDKTSDLVIKVNKNHIFNVHKKLLERLSPKLKEIIKDKKNTRNEVEHRVEDERTFLFMLRFFYPRYHVLLTGA